MRQIGSILLTSLSVFTHPVFGRAVVSEYAQVAEAHPDLARVISKNFLHRHMTIHGHRLEWEDGEPCMRYEGVMTPWCVLRERVELDESGVLKDHFYTYEGLVEGTSSSVIRPFKKCETCGYSLDVVTYTDSFPPHVWVRLINAEGEIISVGMFPSLVEKSARQAVTALVPQTGCVHSPDVYEIRSPSDKWVTTSWEISKEQYESVLAYVVAMQQDAEMRYQLLAWGGHNCAVFVQEACALIGIDVPTTSLMMPVPNPYDIRKWQLSQ